MLAFMSTKWFMWTMILVVVGAFRCLWMPRGWRQKFCKACRVLDTGRGRDIY